MDGLQKAKAELERARANLVRARDAMPGAGEPEGEVPKHRLMAAEVAAAALTGAENAVECCETLVALAERQADAELLKAISQVERAAIYASKAVVQAMTLARLELEWLTD